MISCFPPFFNPWEKGAVALFVLENCTVSYTAQHSTVQYSTVEYSYNASSTITNYMYFFLLSSCQGAKKGRYGWTGWTDGWTAQGSSTMLSFFFLKFIRSKRKKQQKQKP